MRRMRNGLSEFKGTTKQAIADLKEDIGELKKEVAGIKTWMFAVTILLTVAVIERLPILINLAFGSK
jgi:hypothetical protein